MHNARIRPLAAARQYARGQLMARDITRDFHRVAPTVSLVLLHFRVPSICASGIEAAIHYSPVSVSPFVSVGRQQNHAFRKREDSNNLLKAPIGGEKHVYLPLGLFSSVYEYFRRC